MKKSLIIIMLAVVSFSATAQDTLQLKDLRQIGNYYFYDSLPSDDESLNPAAYVGPMHGGETAKYFFTKDSLTIYGIAASVKVTGSPLEFVYDTTAEAAYEYLRLYEPCPDSLLCLRQTKVHPGYTPVAYYADFDQWHSPSLDYYITPVYECYFRPKTVVDSFYVGMTQWGNYPYIDSAGNPWSYRHRVLGIQKLGVLGDYPELWFTSYYERNPHVWFHNISLNGYTLIFPILTPNPDTTATGDTLGVAEASLLDRLTGVMPNPATGKARVVSSFGISLVEVYSPGGALVLSQHADGLHVDIDVSRWPAGTYLVRIHTPQGVAVKKLVVSR